MHNLLVFVNGRVFKLMNDFLLRVLTFALFVLLLILLTIFEKKALRRRKH